LPLMMSFWMFRLFTPNGFPDRDSIAPKEPDPITRTTGFIKN